GAHRAARGRGRRRGPGRARRGPARDRRRNRSPRCPRGRGPRGGRGRVRALLLGDRGRVGDRGGARGPGVSDVGPDPRSVELERRLGPATAKALGTVGIRTVADLLRHYPRRYAEPGKLTQLASLQI